MCERSGGLVANVEGNKIHDSLQEMLTQKIVACNLTIRIKLHKYLKFRNEPADKLSDDNSTLTRLVGNASDENIDFTFEYEIKSIQELRKLKADKLEDIKELPFQLEAEYTALDGSKYTRVSTHKLPVSNDREKLEEEANAEILCANAIQ